MRLPNGYGSITKLSGNRRKPFMVRITKDYDDEGRQKRIVLGYYETRKKALEALSTYNENPYDIEASKITFSQLYKMWSEEKYKEISASAARTYKSAYSYCKPLYDLMLSEIKAPQMQDIVDYADVGATTRAGIQSLFKLMFKYAMKYDYIKKDYSEFVKRPTIIVENDRKPFTAQEVDFIYQSALFGNHYAKILSILIYTGWRPAELCELTFENDIDLKEMTAIGGKKTKAGENRIIPFCNKIIPFIKEFHKKGYKAITVDTNGKYLNYNKLYRRLKDYLKEIGLNHIPYECRHTFATMLDNKDINTKIKKLLMGHASTDVTEKVYTHKTIEQLRNAVNSL